MQSNMQYEELPWNFAEDTTRLFIKKPCNNPICPDIQTPQQTKCDSNISDLSREDLCRLRIEEIDKSKQAVYAEDPSYEIGSCDRKE